MKGLIQLAEFERTLDASSRAKELAAHAEALAHYLDDRFAVRVPDWLERAAMEARELREKAERIESLLTEAHRLLLEHERQVEQRLSAKYLRAKTTAFSERADV